MAEFMTGKDGVPAILTNESDIPGALLFGLLGSLVVLPLIWFYVGPLSPAMAMYLVAKLLFWIFAAGVMFLPPRWALLSLMLVMQIDVSVPGFVGGSSIGWENAVKAVVLPVVIFLRVAPPDWRNLLRTKSSYLWVLFICYVAVATAWSPYKLAAVKMIGYLLCYFFLFWAFAFAWTRFVDAKLLLTALWGSLALAFLQTYVMGNPMSPEEPGRLSSFCWPQTFAPWLVAMLGVLLLWESGLRFRRLSIGFCGLAIILTGSRFAFLGMVCLCFVAWLGRSARFNMASILKSVAATVLILLVVCGGVLYAAPSSRLRELLLFGTNPDYQSVDDIGTFAARILTYNGVLTDISSEGWSKRIFGFGTSTGGDSILAHNLVATIGFAHEDFVDRNRALNSDFFRIMYEWGAAGLCLASVLLVFLTRSAWCLALRLRSIGGFALLGLIPTILLGLLTENVLVDAASPLGVGFVFTMAWAYSEANSRAIAKAPAQYLS